MCSSVHVQFVVMIVINQMLEQFVFQLGMCTAVSHKRWRTQQRKCRKREKWELLCKADRKVRNRMRGSIETGVDIKTETNTVCLLFMCYCSDKGCMPERRPGAHNPVFTSQIRHSVHNLFRVLRWCHSLSNLLKLLRCSKHNGCFTLCLMQNASFV